MSYYYLKILPEIFGSQPLLNLVLLCVLGFTPADGSLHWCAWGERGAGTLHAAWTLQWAVQLSLQEKGRQLEAVTSSAIVVKSIRDCESEALLFST